MCGFYEKMDEKYWENIGVCKTFLVSICLVCGLAIVKPIKIRTMFIFHFLNLLVLIFIPSPSISFSFSSKISPSDLKADWSEVSSVSRLQGISQ